MTTNKPEAVAWRWRKPVVNDRGETVGGVWKLGGAPAFLPWWTNEPLIRLSDYERLQAECENLVEALSALRGCVMETRGPDAHSALVLADAALAARRVITTCAAEIGRDQ